MGGLREERILKVEESGFGAGMDWATLWRGCWVHLPENGSLGYCGFGIRFLRFRTGVSVGRVLKV